MKKIYQYIKRKDTIFCFIIFFIVILLATQIFPVILSYDYLWNFQSTYKMYNGYEIYKDINVIVTPFFFYIGLIFFKLFCPNFLVFNIYGAIIGSLIITLVYKILKKLECGKSLAFLTTLALYSILQKSLFSNGPNYNFLVLAVILMGIYLEIKQNKKQNRYTDLLQGIITFFVLFTKQNMGVYYLLAITVYKFIKYKNLRESIKCIMKIYSVIFLLGISFLIYLKVSGICEGFFYYVISGTGDFLSNASIPAIGNSDMFFLIIPITILVLGVIGIKKQRFSEEENNNIKLLICTAIASIGYIIPLVNDGHIVKAAVINIIGIVYICKLIFDTDIKINIKIFKITFTILIIMIIVEIVRIVYACSTEKMLVINDTKSPFFCTTMPRQTYEEIQIITSYIQEKEKQGIKVIVISEYSTLYAIPLKQSNGRFDCLNNGNLGEDAGQGVIDEIKEMINTEILIVTDDKNVFWQQPEEVRTYIKENLEYAGEIEQFSIYKTK